MIVIRLPCVENGFNKFEITASLNALSLLQYSHIESLVFHSKTDLLIALALSALCGLVPSVSESGTKV